MKTLILPVEIFRREIDGRLLHALVALREGWSVIIGANLEISRNIWRMPRGVFLFSTLSYKRRLLGRLLKNMGFATQGWDEEGLVYLCRELYLARRVSTETLQLLDQVFSWGEASRRDLDVKASTIGKQVHAIGNPRIDLLRLGAGAIYREQCDAIQKEHGDFVLVNTNFSSVNFIQKNVNTKAKKVDKADHRQMAALYEKQYAHRKFMFARFMEAIPQIACALPRGLRLIVRPHPGEDADTWKRVLGDCPNARVVSEGPIIPWLLAARGLVHNDCTTAVEARLLGRNPIAFVPPDMPRDGVGTLPNGISHHAATLSELQELIAAAVRDELRITDQQQAVLQHYVSGTSGPLAAEQAVRHAGQLLKEMHAPSTGKAAMTRMLAVGRHAWKEITPRGWRSRKYISRVFPADQENYMLQRLHDLAQVLDMDAGDISFARIGRKTYLLRMRSGAN